MSWNPVMRAGGALAMYIALMCGFIAGFSPTVYALFAALVLALGLALHTIEFRSHANRKASAPVAAVLPSLSESMAELLALQNDINELQQQFAAENVARTANRDGRQAS